MAKSSDTNIGETKRTSHKMRLAGLPTAPHIQLPYNRAIMAAKHIRCLPQGYPIHMDKSAELPFEASTLVELLRWRAQRQAG